LSNELKAITRVWIWV